jgi:PDZ domain-containing protein
VVVSRTPPEAQLLPGATSESADGSTPNGGRHGEGEGPASSRKRTGPAWLVFVPVAALLLILAIVPSPYFLLTPGPAEDVLPLIHVSGRATYQPEGHLLLTAVGFQRARVFQALAARILPHHELHPEQDFLAPGQTDRQQLQVAFSEMDTSKIDAAVVALRRFTNYPTEHGPGALVDFVESGLPADGKIFAGDLITAADGKQIADPGQLGRVIVAAGAGHPITFTIRARGKTRQATVAPTIVKQVDHPIIGISTVANFPFPLTISSGNISGPSAGLMWALGVSDVLTPGDLTGGRTIAGTGEIGPDGKVYPIGGVQEKVVAAERAGASVFIVPTEDAPSARAVADHITLVPVATYAQALNWLLAHGGKA